MSAWWLLIAVPATLIGFASAALLTASAAGRSWHEGYGRGFHEGWTAGVEREDAP